MKVYFSQTKRKVKFSFSTQVREHLYLKVEWGNGIIGYTEYSPWTHLNQPSIQDILYSAHPLFDHLISRCLKDATLYRQYLLAEPINFKNHSLFSGDDLFSISPEVMKIKLRGRGEKDHNILQEVCGDYKWIRLDANEKYSLNEFLDFWSGLDQKIKQRVEYIEDPIPWVADDYQRLYERGIPIRLDQAFNQYLCDDFDQIICKQSLRINHFSNYKHPDTIFSTNMMGNLSSWQDACDLSMLADLNLCHGIYSPSLFENEESLFVLQNEYITVDRNVVEDTYKLLKETSWSLLEL